MNSKARSDRRRWTRPHGITPRLGLGELAKTFYPAHAVLYAFLDGRDRALEPDLGRPHWIPRAQYRALRGVAYGATTSVDVLDEVRQPQDSGDSVLTTPASIREALYWQLDHPTTGFDGCISALKIGIIAHSVSVPDAVLCVRGLAAVYGLTLLEVDGSDCSVSCGLPAQIQAGVRYAILSKVMEASTAFLRSGGCTGPEFSQPDRPPEADPSGGGVDPGYGR